MELPRELFERMHRVQQAPRSLKLSSDGHTTIRPIFGDGIECTIPPDEGKRADACGGDGNLASAEVAQQLHSEFASRSKLASLGHMDGGTSSATAVFKVIGKALRKLGGGFQAGNCEQV